MREKIFVICSIWRQKEKGDQQVFCYRSGDETGLGVGLDLEDQKERCGFVFSLLISLAEMTLGLARMPAGARVGTK